MSLYRFLIFYTVFHNCWNKAAASKIFVVDFILFLFSGYYREIGNILMWQYARWPVPTIPTSLTSSWLSDRLVVSLISGQGHFTLLYKHTTYTTERVEEKNIQARTWVSSKRKVLTPYLASAFLWPSPFLDFCWLPSSVGCPETLPFLVFFRSRRRSRAQALCVDFAPKKQRNPLTGTHPHPHPQKRIPNIMPHWYTNQI